MSRPLRIEYSGAVHHVYSRGNDKGIIFYQDSDRRLLLSIFAKTIKNYNWICHAYCLMHNHYHLCIETPEANLSAGMRDLNSEYAQTFNSRYGAVGHLFQGRFGSILIEKESYLLEVVAYIVLNPVRSKFIFHPKDWPWSNYRATAGFDVAPDWLEINWTRNLFADNHQDATKRYQEYILCQNNEPSPFKKIYEGKILGSPQFIDSIWEKYPDTDKITETSKPERIIGRPSLEDIFADIRDKKDRNDAIKFARCACGYSVTAIACHLGISQTLVSLIYRDKIDHRGSFLK